MCEAVSPCRAAEVVRAIDQDTAHAHVAHMAEDDLLGPHAAIKAALAAPRKLSIPEARKGCELLPIVGVESRRV
jgi:hypothetical protein